MVIYIFGNPDLETDSLPIRILPELQKALPEISFKLLDPIEEWEIPETFNIIDTVIGITEPTVFGDLRVFRESPRVSVHDYDAFFNLIYLEKLGKLKHIRIFGVPSGMADAEAAEKLTNLIKKSII